jgi:hypothetical protein
MREIAEAVALIVPDQPLTMTALLLQLDLAPRLQTLPRSTPNQTKTNRMLGKSRMAISLSLPSHLPDLAFCAVLAPEERFPSVLGRTDTHQPLHLADYRRLLRAQE